MNHSRAIHLPSPNEAVRIRAMRKLLIRSCLIAGLTWTYSCASNKETAPQAPAPGSSRSAGTNRPGGPSRTLGSRSGATGNSSRG